MRTLGLTLLATAAAAVAVQNVAATPLEPSLKIASALSGTWQTRLQGNVDEILEFGGFTSRGYGTFSSRKIRANRTVETIEGYWRLHRNPLLPIRSRWQIKLSWRSANWGKQNRSLAIRRLTRSELILGNVYLDSMNVTYRRLN